MEANPVIDLSELIDRHGVTRFHILLLGLTMAIILTDGYDVVSIAYVAPVLLREWHFSPASLGLLFGSGFLGGLFGPALFGYLADRYGRRYTTILGTAFFGLFTVAQVWATDLEQLIALRFVAGIGISGIVPTLMALNAEFSPRRLQTTIAIFAFLGIAIGGLLAGVIASTLIASMGWPIVFWVGGLLPLLFSVIGLFVYPESVKFLSLHPHRRPELFETLRRLIPSYAVPQDAAFVIGGEINREFRFLDLFRGWLALGTPLLWLINVLTLMVFFFVNQWMPTILSTSGFSDREAFWGTMALQIGNIVGAFLLIRPLRDWGYWAVALGCGVTVPFLAILGIPGMSLYVVLGAVFVSGIGIAWLQFGDIAVESQVYSTYTRSWGIGICFAFLRLGSLIGPVAGGVLIGLKLPFEQLFYIVAATQGLNFLATVLFAPVYRRRMQELAVSEPLAASSPIVAGH